MAETVTADREDLAEKASEFLLGVLERMGISADIDIKDDKDRTTLEIQTKDTELVIGRRGVVMDALQHLVNKVVYRDRRDEKTKPLVVDAGGFRDKQVERLRALGQRMAEKCLETKEVVALQPMTAHDRRIVHMAISEITGVKTQSEGEGEDRHITIIPA
ncbi:MAG TPA: R3H domain-containing nucleic acid-binding protein [Kofleriaceae bacterium]